MVLQAIQHLAQASNSDAAGSPTLLVAGVAVVATTTIAGAWLARRQPEQRQMWFGAAAGALLVIALMHLLPDAWSGAQHAGLPAWTVLVVAGASFTMTLPVSRLGCTCQADQEHTSGASAASALAAHRFLEGAALALTGPVTAVALAVHALGEGMAVAALLRTQPRRLAAWLAIMCVGPVIGAVAADAIPALDLAEPLLLAAAAGVLAQAARISLRAAYPRPLQALRSTTAPTAAVLVAALLTTLAVYGIG
jgi:zinc transporter ZupT